MPIGHPVTKASIDPGILSPTTSCLEPRTSSPLHQRQMQVPKSSLCESKIAMRRHRRHPETRRAAWTIQPVKRSSVANEARQTSSQPALCMLQCSLLGSVFRPLRSEPFACSDDSQSCSPHRSEVLTSVSLTAFTLFLNLRRRIGYIRNTLRISISLVRKLR